MILHRGLNKNNFCRKYLETIAICSGFYKQFASTYYKDKDYIIIYIFRDYIKSSLKDIDHPVLIGEWELNPDKVEYEKRLDAGENKMSLKN